MGAMTRARFFFGSTAPLMLVLGGFAACRDAADEAPSGHDAVDASNARDAQGAADAREEPARPEDGSSPGDATVDAAVDGHAPAHDAGSNLGAMALVSTAFTNGGTIPVVHSVCDGANASIPLSWSGAPAGAKSFAVVMRDLTLGGSANYHWVLYDVPPTVTSLAQGVPKDLAPNPPGGGAKQTRWSFGANTGYQGMCPIAGPSTHLYELSVYAIDVATLPAPADPADPAQVDAQIQAHQIGYGRLQGSYTKK